MSVAGRDFICLSTHYWDGRRFRKQEFMSRFAKTNRVLFVEPSFSMVRRPEAHLRQSATNRHLVPRIEQRTDSLYLLKPPRGLPKWTDARVEKLTYRWYGRLVGQAAQRLRFRNPIVWVYRPAFYHGLAAIPRRHLVFDLVDDLAAYGDGDGEANRHVEEQITGLVRASSLFVATAKTLLDRYGHAASRAVHVPNGFDAGLFSPERTPPEGPPALKGISRPILGFVGTLFTFLDFDLLEQVARVHNDKSLVLVGPVEHGASRAFSQLTKLPNVYHLGDHSQASIPYFVAAFDLCLNPFRRGRAADSVSPLKVYEYLAMGRPVISTPMCALQQEAAASAVIFADTPAEFCERIDWGLTNEVQQETLARRRAVADYSWDRLFDRVAAACDRAFTH